MALTSAKVYENVEVLREKEGITVLVGEGSRPGEKLERATGRDILQEIEEAGLKEPDSSSTNQNEDS